MNYLNIYPTSIVDGLGIRTSIYLSGCDMNNGKSIDGHCFGCHNPESHSFCNGKLYTEETENKLIEYLSKSYCSGLCISGGEPMSIKLQKEVSEILKRIRPHLKKNQDIWLFSGFEWEDFLDNGKRNTKYTQDILINIDVAVLGPFIIEKRDITANNPFRGSTNQYIIDVKETLRQNKIILLEGIKNNSLNN